VALNLVPCFTPDHSAGKIWPMRVPSREVLTNL
jgi:hypothetical protein